jgi:hypothetical protein
VRGIEAAPESRDLVVATSECLPAHAARRALTTLAARVEVAVLLDRPPLHWLRIQTEEALPRSQVHEALAAAGARVRYVASARRPSQNVGPPLTFGAREAARPTAWPAAPVDRPTTGGANRWFAERDGLNIDRRACGTGAGTRLGVIDNDAGAADALGLDAVVPILREEPDRSSYARHGASLGAWAVGAVSPAFEGVAPRASIRLYAIPKPGNEIVALPSAIVRAVDDGADVVVCATYIEGTTSPMLDDALSFARAVGRGGRGTAVVVPTGREIRSADGFVQPSLSLDLGDPASDPRVFCVGPSGRQGAWFLFRDKSGAVHPFANRGPAVRWLAPGDDVPDPFVPGRAGHAESSGAAAFAAGSLLLVLATNPLLSVDELDSLITATAAHVPPDAGRDAFDAASSNEILPLVADGDGHNAKHGYGRIDAERACLAAADPISFTLVSMGDVGAARRWSAIRDEEPSAGGYSGHAARALVVAIVRQPSARHALAVVLRHLRLVAGRPARAAAHADGAVLRQLTIVARSLCCGADGDTELPPILEQLSAATGDDDARRAVDGIAVRLAARVWSD